MTKTITVEKMTSELFRMWQETFEKTDGIYLDRDTSLFDTLATISAEEASQPVSARCASIAAHVEHVRYYIEVLEGYMIGKPLEKVDWHDIWNRVEKVTPHEWELSKNRLRETYQRLMATMKNLETWDGEEEYGAALAIVIHTAHHLGEIRQAMCTIKSV